MTFGGWGKYEQTIHIKSGEKIVTIVPLKSVKIEI